MLPFHFEQKSGIPIYEQVVQAVKRAIATQQLKPGAPFPSVRELSTALRINPNTAQKVISALVRENLLEVQPGIGSLVSSRAGNLPDQAALLLGEKLEQLIIEALTVGITKDAFVNAVKQHWDRFLKKEVS